MQNVINSFLSKYFDNAINKNKTLLCEFDKFFEFSNNLEKEKRITDGESNEFVNNLSELVEFVIKVVSECPYIEININDKNKNLNVEITRFLVV